ncbi:uncharacterized protein [Eurosta solidaginis]|uniref:uncharacterized protein n=1 Tax=Eurosta solidaginis TaxID=178769 RepID=UPI003531168A
MNPDKFYVVNENNNGKSETSTSVNKSETATNTKSQRTQKIRWSSSTEEETYRTVVVNYRYDRMDKKYPRNTGAISKTKHCNRTIAAMATKQPNNNEKDDDNVPSLRKLYDYSSESLCTDKIPNTPVPSCENIAVSCKVPEKEAIKLEVFYLPVEQEAIVEEHQLKTIHESDIESLPELGDGGNCDSEGSKFEKFFHEHIDEATGNSTDTTSMTLTNPSYNDLVFLRDNEIGETPDFDADFCCAMTKDEVDGAQQTCIIKNTTKATQKPERHSERLQTARRSREPRFTSASTQHTNEHCLQLTVAEIPKDAGKSKSTPTQSGFRQRQQELHRYRIAVEQKRLELLELKLQRERDEMLREQIIFEKELQLRASQLRHINDDKTVDILGDYAQ